MPVVRERARAQAPQRAPQRRPDARKLRAAIIKLVNLLLPIINRNYSVQL